MNSVSTQAYSIRQLSPFQGLVQVVRGDYARALSGDGVNWQIQVSCEVHQQRWGILNTPNVQRRYVLYGMWNSEHGLTGLPLDPTLDVPSEHDIKQALLPLLPPNQTLPLPQRDRYELWLLDRDGLPMALLASSIDAYNLSNIDVKRWRAVSDRSRPFQPQRATLGGDALLMLERLISDHATAPIRSQWFLRDTAGDGISVSDDDSQSAPHRVDADLFPELLIRERWPDAQQQLLAEDYHHWLAPRLLLLQNIPDTVRDRLEHAAQHHALEANRFYHLYPKIINRDILNKIRVEARLRKSM